MSGATVRAVTGAVDDMPGQEGKFTFRAAGNFGAAASVRADKPEDEFFITGIDEGRDVQVVAAVNGVIEMTKAKHAGIFVTGVIDIM